MKHHTITSNINRVKKLGPQWKARLIAECDAADKRNEDKSSATSFPCSSQFCYIVEKCFDKRKGDVTIQQIRDIVMMIE